MRFEVTPVGDRAWPRPPRPRVGLPCAAVVMLLAQLPGLSGCGGETDRANTSHLQGQITLNGEAIAADADASITFKPTRSGQAKTCFARIADGRFDSPKTPKGPVKVYISIQQPTGKMVSEAGGTPYAEIRSLVPASAARGIELEVREDNFEQNFDLQ